MEVEIYKMLSRYYDNDWGQYALKYIDLLSALCKEHRIDSAEILDLGCGSGTLAYELAILGHKITGLDKSSDMIEIARHKCRNHPQVKFKVGDMAEFKLERKFDLITCTYDSINYLTGKVQLQNCFRNISEHLKPDGLFVFDSNTAYKYERLSNQIYTHDFKGEKITQRCTYDNKSRLSTTEFVLPDGSTESHIQRPYGRDDLVPYFAKNALEFRHVFGSFKRGVYNETSMRLIGIVQKIS